MKTHSDVSILEAALIGYRVSLEKLNERIADIRQELGGGFRKAAVSITTDGAKPKRNISAAARRRIAQATRKRWAAYRAAKTATAKKSAPRRTMSAATKAKLVANLKKARAARAAKRNSGGKVPF